ncbi:FAD-linked oxidase C-terminal domain-containing protein [Tistrella bauzanensis]
MRSGAGAGGQGPAPGLFRSCRRRQCACQRHGAAGHAGRGYQALQGPIDDAIFDLVAQYRGSISAEHGIGQVKRAYLDRNRSAAEIATMRALKAMLDPNGILNPHRLLP